jgi:hypothetical protein
VTVGFNVLMNGGVCVVGAGVVPMLLRQRGGNARHGTSERPMDAAGSCWNTT